MKIKDYIFPDILALTKKDKREYCTKRYADLRIVNHFIALSWTTTTTLVYYQRFKELVSYMAIVGCLAVARGVIAKIVNNNNNNEHEKNNNISTIA